VLDFWLGREACGQILVLCEPNDGQREIMSMLTAFEHRCLFVDRLSEAYEILEQEQIELIISAVHLEKSDTYEFLTRVKTSNQWKEIPFVFLCLPGTKVARHINHTLKMAAKALGASKYLSLENHNIAWVQEEIASCLPHHQVLTHEKVPMAT
jgi:CheY-like chemotaxis protein